MYRIGLFPRDGARSMGENDGRVKMEIVFQMLFFHPILETKSFSSHLSQNTAHNCAVLRTVRLKKSASVITCDAGSYPGMIWFSTQDGAFDRYFADFRPVLD